jgi:hypothetical protein
VPLVLGIGNCQYTQVTTAGTTTVIVGPAAGIPTSQNVLYGANVSVFGTTPTIACYDLVPPTPAGGTTTQTFLLMAGTFTAAGQALSPSAGNVGARIKGSLAVVTTGTANTWNVLWD